MKHPHTRAMAYTFAAVSKYVNLSTAWRAADADMRELYVYGRSPSGPRLDALIAFCIIVRFDLATAVSLTGARST